MNFFSPFYAFSYDDFNLNISHCLLQMFIIPQSLWKWFVFIVIVIIIFFSFFFVVVVLNQTTQIISVLIISFQVKHVSYVTHCQFLIRSWMLTYYNHIRLNATHITLQPIYSLCSELREIEKDKQWLKLRRGLCNCSKPHMLMATNSSLRTKCAWWPYKSTTSKRF